ncbi:MAG TPA: hypothetical protein VMU83_17995 [Hanamia sp.]|nr:hypothetical protein [Hanamia sp.]
MKCYGTANEFIRIKHGGRLKPTTERVFINLDSNRAGRRGKRPDRLLLLRNTAKE